MQYFQLFGELKFALKIGLSKQKWYLLTPVTEKGGVVLTPYTVGPGGRSETTGMLSISCLWYSVDWILSHHK